MKNFIFIYEEQFEGGFKNGLHVLTMQTMLRLMQPW